MKNEEENTKKVWQAPEIYDLDVDKTATAGPPGFFESTTAGPS